MHMYCTSVCAWVDVVCVHGVCEWCVCMAFVSDVCVRGVCMVCV